MSSRREDNVSSHSPKRDSYGSSRRSKNTSGPRSSSTQKSRKELPLSHRTEATAAKSSSQPPSDVSYTSTSASDPSRGSTVESFDKLVYTHTYLIEVSAWTTPQPEHYYQDISYPENMMRTFACHYHASMLAPGNYNTQRGYGLVPLERWVEEDARDGGALALNLGGQPRLDCTCDMVVEGIAENISES